MSLFRPAFYERDLERDAKFQAKREVVQKKREEILARLTDAKSMRIGIDAEALARQAEEKHQREAAEAARWDGAAVETKRILDTVTALERQADAQRKQVIASTRDYVQHQIEHPETRDTWDLNDPRRLRKMEPVRRGDDDPRLGPASAQVFAGEDVLAPERRKLQHAQMQTWTAQQMAEKAAKEAAEKEANRAYMEWYNAQEAALGGLAAGLSAEVKARTLDAAAYNVWRMQEDRRKKQADKEQERAMSQVAMETLMTRGAGMGLLAEDVADGMSCADPRRYRPDYYRGQPSGAHDKAAVSAEIDRLVQEKAERKAMEAEEEARRVKGDKAELRAALLQERENQARTLAAKAAAKAALDEQIRDAQAKREAERQAKRSGAAGTGFGPEFFENFGKSLF